MPAAVAVGHQLSVPAASSGPRARAHSRQGRMETAAEGKCTHSTRLMKATEKQGRLHTAASTSRRDARQLLHVPVRDAEPGQPPVDSVRGQASTRLTAARAPPPACILVCRVGVASVWLRSSSCTCTEGAAAMLLGSPPSVLLLTGSEPRRLFSA